MNIYAISPTEVPMPTNIQTLNTFPNFFHLKILFMIIIFVAGAFIAVKHIAKDLEENNLLKFLYFFLPIIGIIVFFISLSKDKKKAIAILKITFTGIITYTLMVASVGILTYIEFIMPL